VQKVTDTLHIAREKHPGQRNSLDALVKRYDIGGYDRELHGALLDSKILGEVYLSMTGGQGALNFEQENRLEENITEDSSSKSFGEIKRTKSIELTKEEVERNKEYLNSMEEETGVKPLWLRS